MTLGNIGHSTPETPNFVSPLHSFAGIVKQCIMLCPSLVNFVLCNAHEARDPPWVCFLHCEVANAMIHFPQTIFSEYNWVCPLFLTANLKTYIRKIKIPTFPLSPLILIAGNLIQASQLKQSNGGSVGFAVAGEFSGVWSISCLVLQRVWPWTVVSCLSACWVCFSLTVRALSLLHINACGVRKIADWANA